MSSPVHRIDVLNLSEVEIAKFRSHLPELSTDQCWEYRTKEPRGRIFFYRESGKVRIIVTRLAYYLHYKVDPGELFVCHHCDNPLCCNPHHLFLGTHDDNMQDKVAKGRQAKVKFGDSHWTRTNPEKIHTGNRHWTRHSPEKKLTGDKHWMKSKPERISRGEGRHNTHLKESDILIIRSMAEQGRSNSEIMTKFQISRASVVRIVKRQCWKHIP